MKLSDEVGRAKPEAAMLRVLTRSYLFICFCLVMSLAGSAVAELVAYVNSSEVVVTPVEVLSYQ